MFSPTVRAMNSFALCSIQPWSQVELIKDCCSDKISLNIHPAEDNQAAEAFY